MVKAVTVKVEETLQRRWVDTNQAMRSAILCIVDQTIKKAVCLRFWRSIAQVGRTVFGFQTLVENSISFVLSSKYFLYVTKRFYTFC